MYSAAGRTVTVIDAPSVDSNGIATTPTPRAVDDVVLGPQSTSTSVVGHGQVAVTIAQARLPIGDPIQPLATVVIPAWGALPDMGVWRVEGDPIPVVSELSGRCFGLLVDLRKIGVGPGSPVVASGADIGSATDTVEVS